MTTDECCSTLEFSREDLDSFKRELCLKNEGGPSLKFVEFWSDVRFLLLIQQPHCSTIKTNHGVLL